MIMEVVLLAKAFALLVQAKINARNAFLLII